MTLLNFLILSTLLFSIGLFGLFTRRNLLGIFMSIELMFNAANINFLAFNHFLFPDHVWGHGWVLFVIALAAAEAVVGLSLVLMIYKNFKSVYTEKLSLLHG